MDDKNVSSIYNQNFTQIDLVKVKKIKSSREINLFKEGY